jgi:hypothetical protein
LLTSFRDTSGDPDSLRCAELLVAGRDAGEHVLREALSRHGITGAAARTAASAAVDAIAGWEVRCTGAEAIAAVLRQAGVTHVFAYAGTSELAMCDAIDRSHDVALVNGRGDKESAFMAAGGSLLRANRAAAILHAARGLTNAAGAVADARRNEAGTMFVVGMPSTGSARFLPPHGEPDLLGGMRAFADWCWQAPAIPARAAEHAEAARTFVSQLRWGLAAIARPPQNRGRGSRRVQRGQRAARRAPAGRSQGGRAERKEEHGLGMADRLSRDRKPLRSCQDPGIAPMPFG